MAIAVYPFVGKVAELIGRLTAIQGDFSAAEIHRRISETYGERETAHRAAKRVIRLRPVGEPLSASTRADASSEGRP